MTTGVLIFAYNNELVDYLAMANWAAKNIRRHLNLPIAVVTDQPCPSKYRFEQVIIAQPTSSFLRKFADQEENVTWYNGNRVDAYLLSPWAHTLVLDADYVVASNDLLKILSIDKNFVAHKTAYDVVNKDNFNELNNFGRHNMPMWWATVMMFRRSTEAKLIFETMTMIRDNWDHYKALYGITKSTYRNDFALSIAMNIVDGHTLSTPSIPWPLMSLTSLSRITQLEPDTYRIDYENSDTEGKPKWILLKNQDFHAMGKKSLGDIVANPC